jgi:hypothetical protein
MQKYINFMPEIGTPDIRAEFWAGETKFITKRLTDVEEEGLSVIIDLESVRKGNIVVMGAERLWDDITTGVVEFQDEDNDWTNFEAILHDLMNDKLVSS